MCCPNELLILLFFYTFGFVHLQPIKINFAAKNCHILPLDFQWKQNERWIFTSAQNHSSTDLYDRVEMERSKRLAEIITRRVYPFITADWKAGFPFSPSTHRARPPLKASWRLNERRTHLHRCAPLRWEEVTSNKSWLLIDRSESICLYDVAKISCKSCQKDTGDRPILSDTFHQVSTFVCSDPITSGQTWY